MKKLLIAASLVAALSTPALAIDFGNGLALNNSVVGTYNLETAGYSLDFSTEMTYAVSTEVLAYLGTSVDLLNPAFSGMGLGIEYSPAQIDSTTFMAEVRFDSNFEYSDAVIGIEFKF